MRVSASWTCHLVVVGVGELELLQHQREGQAGLGERKLPADTGTHAVAERLVGVRVVVDPVLRQPPVDVKLLRPVPRLGVGVQRALEDVDPRSLLQLVATPPMTVSSSGDLPIIGMGAHRRRVSSRMRGITSICMIVS